MTLCELLIHMRQRLLDARERQDNFYLQRIGNAFSVIEQLLEEEYGEKGAERKLFDVISDMNYAAKDSLARVPFKSTIPSIQDIKDATESI